MVSLVISMKKTIKTIFLAFLCGVLLSVGAIYYLGNKFSLINQQNTVTAFQIGVYKSKENAEKVKERYPGSISVQDGDYYRVYVGVAKDKNCEILLESYFLNQNMNVYPKIVEVTKEFSNELYVYENSISKDNIEVYEKVNQEMLKKLESELL